MSMSPQHSHSSPTTALLLPADLDAALIDDVMPHKWRLSGSNFSILVDKRNAVLTCLLLLLGTYLSLVCLNLGDERFSWNVLVKALSLSQFPDAFILYEIRIPRLLATLVAGYALGVAGGIVQTIFRNRLATPDILGLNEGATLAIVCFVLYFQVAEWPIWIAPFGAMIAVAILYSLSHSPKHETYVFLICGICLSEFFRAIVEFMMSTGALHEVQSIYIWLHGSFNGVIYQNSLAISGIILLALPVQFYLSHNLKLLELSHKVAHGLGLDYKRIQLVGIILAVLLSAFGTSIGGPIVFVAMGAPIIVSYLAKSYTPPLFIAGLLGSLLLMLSDTLARTLTTPTEVPTGVVTRMIGGLFLFWLLTRKNIE